MLSDDQRRQAANALAAAERDSAAIDPLTQTLHGIDVEDAYVIQVLQVGDRLAEGRQLQGFKVGLTAAAMQEMLGVAEPDYGHLLDDMFVADGGTIPASRLCAPRAEVEVAFVLKDRLQGPGVSANDVIEATAHLKPAIEVIDSRIRDWKIKLPDTIADNASSARVVVGSGAVPVGAVDLPAIGAVLRRNGQIVETGTGSAVMGNPAEAVAWLANTLHAFGVTLEPGWLVLPGSCTRAVDVAPGDLIEGEFDGLGRVRVSFA